MNDAGEVSRPTGTLTGGVGVAVATSVANILAYVLTVAGTRLLGPAEFGAFGALLAVIIVGYVAALAVQATTAKAVAAHEDPAPGVRAGLLLAGITGLLTAALSPLLRDLLQLSSVVPVLAVAVSVAALAVTAAPLGVVQGGERFGTFAVLLIVQNVLRVGGGLVAMLIRPTTASAMIGIAAGYLAAAVIAWAASRPPLLARRGMSAAFRSTLASAAMLLGFIALTNIDVLLARHVLTAQDSGLYAAGAIFTKIAFWLPQFVPLVVFPALVDPIRRRGAMRRGMVIVAAFGAVVVAGSALFAEQVVRLVAGTSYAELANWVAGFTALGAMYAIAYLLVYAHLARGDRWTIAVIWATLIGYVVVVEATAHTVPGVLLPGLGAASVIIAWGFVREHFATPLPR
jgi:O-antigen/teichoic acid export membrane protein